MLDYRKKQREDRKFPADEQELVNRMRLFARFHNEKEHKTLINDILKAKRLRKEIARLQMYQRMGFNSLLDVERFELDRNRRESHRIACRQKEKEEEEEQQAAAKAAGELVVSGSSIVADDKETYHRQYKNSDRKIRKSINRFQNDHNNSTDENEKGALNELNENAKHMNSPKIPINITSSTNGSNNPISSSDVEENSALDKESVTNMSPLAKDSSVTNSIRCDGFDVKNYEAYELLSSKEIGLCQRLKLKPKAYLEAKKTLIEESLARGILDDTTKSSKRSVGKIDVKANGDVVKFILQSGWTSSAPSPIGSNKK